MTSGGFTLVTVRLVDPVQVYRDIDYQVTSDDLIAIGALPPAPAITPVAAPAVNPNLAGPSRRPHSSPVRAGDNDLNEEGSNPVVSGGHQEVGTCVPTANAQFVDFSPTITVTLAPVMNFGLIISDSALNYFRFEAGAAASVNIDFLIKLQAAVNTGIDCLLARNPGLEASVPGPLSGLVSMYGDQEVHAKVDVKVTTLPKVEFGFNCSGGVSIIMGVQIDSRLVLSDRSRATRSFDCTKRYKPNVQLSSDSTGATVDITGGIYATQPMGLRMGGVVVGRLAAWLVERGVGFVHYDLGKFQGLEASEGPQVRLAWESSATTLNNQLAASTAALELAFKVTLKPAPLEWLLQKFTAGKLSFTLTLLELRIPIASAYQPINASSQSATTNGAPAEMVDGAIQVAEGDEFVIDLDALPAGGGAQLVNPITSARAYADLVRTDAFNITMPSTYSIRLTATVDADLCALWKDTQEYAVVGDAPMLGEVPAPTWGGTFKLRCRDGAMSFQPASVVGSSDGSEREATVQLRSHGGSNTTWSLDVSTVPEWAIIDQETGELAPSESDSSTPITLSIGGRGPTCDTQIPRSAQVTFTSPHRGRAILVLTQPKVAADTGPTCKKAPVASVGGDPHVSTLDGNYFDAQVLGEYVYLAPTAGNGGSVLHVRHERTNPTQTLGWIPTSITAVAVRSQGHTVEVYARPFELRIDGVPTTLAQGVPLEVTGGFSLVNTGYAYAPALHLVTPDMDLVVTNRGSIFDISVTVPFGAPLQGFLGSPNGIAADDLVGADGSTYLAGEMGDVGAGLDSAVYRFSDTWRITDQQGSLLGRTYAGFADQNPPPNPAALAPFRQQVIDQLGKLSAVCSGETSQLVDSLALELAIRPAGATLADVAGYGCSYVVSGRATAQGIGQGVAGVSVTADAAGLTGCTATTGANGDWSCTLSPSFDEIAGTTPTLPLNVAVTAVWPDEPGFLATGVASFNRLAPVGGNQLGTVDLSIDPATMPRVAVQGTLVRDGGPVTTAVHIVVDAFDAAGARVARTYNDVTPTADGSYVVDVVVPRSAFRVVATARVGVAESEWVSAETTGLEIGRSTPLALSIDLTAPTLVVSGQLTANGQPVTGPIIVEFRGRDAGGFERTYRERVVDPNPATGEYVVSMEMARTVIEATVTVEAGVGYHDWKSTIVTGLVPGARPVRFDVALALPVLDVHGFLIANGAPATQQRQFRVTAWSGESDQTYLDSYLVTTLPAADGSYRFSKTLPGATTRAEVKAVFGPWEGDQYPIMVTSLTPGVRDVPFVVTHAPPTLTIRGHLLLDGGPLPGFTQIGISSFGSDQTTRHGYIQHVVTVNPDGSYELPDVVLFGRTAGVDLVIFTNEYRDQPRMTLPIVPGAQEVTFDADQTLVRTRVHGTITGDEYGPGTTVKFRVQTYIGAQEHGYSIPTVTLDADGSYEITGVWSERVDRVTVTAWVGNYPADYPTVTQVLVKGPNDIELNVDFHPSRIIVEGDLTGVPVPLTDDQHVDIQPLDAGNAPIGPSLQWELDPDPDTRAFSTQALALPLRTSMVRVSYTADVNGADETYSITFDPVGDPGLHVLDFSPVLGEHLRLSGTFSKGGVLQADTTLSINVDMRDVNDQSLETGPNGQKDFNVIVLVDSEGRWSLDLALVPTTNFVSLRANEGTEAFLDVRREQFGEPVVWDIDVSMRRLIVGGTITVDGQPYTGAVTYAGELVDIVADDPGYDTVRQTGGFRYGVPVTAGAYHDERFLPAPNDELQITIYVNGRPYSRHVSISGTSDLVVDFDIDVHTNLLALTVGTWYAPLAGSCADASLRPQMLDAEVWAFDGLPGEYDELTHTWLGGTLLTTTVIQPVRQAVFDPDGVFIEDRWLYRLGVEAAPATTVIGVRYTTDERWTLGIGFGGYATTGVADGWFAGTPLPALCPA